MKTRLFASREEMRLCGHPYEKLMVLGSLVGWMQILEAKQPVRCGVQVVWETQTHAQKNILAVTASRSHSLGAKAFVVAGGERFFSQTG